MAWLVAIPKWTDTTGKEMKLPARIETYKGAGTEAPYPPLSAEETQRRIFDWLMEVGPIESSAMGHSPISWASIDAWARRTYAEPTPWEVRLLRRLSTEYLTESHRAEDRNHPAPWWPEQLQVDHQANERQLRSVLG